MALPVNISELIHGRVVEWERLEFKKGWNPEEILHSVCAFANDINNWGGGYLVIGIEEQNGMPKFPPLGLDPSSIDNIQGKLIGICYQIQPNYLPVMQPYTIDGKHILVVWCPAGDTRPFSCPSTQGNDARRQYYIRSGSRSIVAHGDNLNRLMELTAKIPFDDRINQEADINKLELGLIREFLQEVGSDLFSESTTMPFPELCKSMHIARGPIESLRPVNAGLLFFNSHPHRFFQRAWIELVIHSDDSGTNFIEETFRGPLHKQIRDCLAFLRREVIKTEVKKVSGQAESITSSNYPYNALEEAICNAVYHKNYAEGKPIEIQVLPSQIEILSYPGPLPPITNTDLQQRRVIARDYRNRRIGDFLKELQLTEGKATGIPVIRDAMKANGSPEPSFYTDEEKTLFLVTLPCHVDWSVSKSVSKSVTKIVSKSVTKMSFETVTERYINYIGVQAIALLSNKKSERLKMEIRSTSVTKILGISVSKTLDDSVSKIWDVIDYLTTENTREATLNHIGLTNHSKNYKAYLKPLIVHGLVELTIPDKPNSRHQRYRLTEKGRQLLN